MRILNLLQMNDWKFRNFLVLLLSINFAILGFIALDLFMGFAFPILRPVICLFYLIIIPGSLILRLFNIHKLETSDTLIYSIGLSLIFLMLIGSFINSIFSFLGLSKPISMINLFIIMDLVIVIMCVSCHLVSEKFYRNPIEPYINVRDSFSLPIMCLFLIFLLSLFAVHLMNLNQNNLLMLLFLIIIALYIPFIIIRKDSKSMLYPLIIFIISISLLFHSSLISPYIWGGDILGEFYFAKSVIDNSFWIPNTSHSLNGVLSIVMLPPIFSTFCGLQLEWVFKIIYPFLYSLVPLCLYRIYQMQVNDKVALLAVFYFMTSFSFYTEMIMLARQQIAEIFMVLLLFLIVAKKVPGFQRSILFILFAIGLIVSHYGLSYIYAFSAVLVLVILHLLDRLKKYTAPSLATVLTEHRIEDRNITFKYILFFLIFTLAWYIHVSNSIAFINFIYTTNNIFENMYDIFNPSLVQPVAIIINKYPIAYEVTKYLHIITQLFIFFGLIFVLFNYCKTRIQKEYLIFSLVYFLILGFCLVLPFFAVALQASRFYHISQIVLAPFFIVGFLGSFKILSNTYKLKFLETSGLSLSISMLAIFISVFFLFNSGFMYVVSNELMPSGSLVSLSADLDYPRFNEQEIISTKWLASFKNTNLVYADEYRWGLLESILGVDSVKFYPVYINQSSHIADINNSYFYLGTKNIANNQIVVRPFTLTTLSECEYISAKSVIQYRGAVYENGGSSIFI